MPTARLRPLLLPGVLVVVAAAHLAPPQPTEPFFNGDETRHVMTGVFVRDALFDGGYLRPRAYAERYYAQHPALGLLVWPPGFYAVEGAVMVLFGPTYAVGRAVTFGYALLACCYLFTLARRTHGAGVAAVATLLFGLSREVFTHSRFVMLEVPTLACGLGAAFHLERFLATGRRRDLVLLGLWTVATAYHRYDAVYLAPLFFFRLLLAGRLSLLVTRRVLLAGLLAVAVIAPVYWLAYREIGGQHALGATVGTSRRISTGLFRLENFAFYPMAVPFQMGTLATAFAVVGLLASLHPAKRKASQPYWAMLLAVYVTFSPMAELESRHAIYWVPALAVLAADAAFLPLRLWRVRLSTAVAAAAVVIDCGVWTLNQPHAMLTGYRAAARFVAEHTRASPACLFNGLMDGTFVYEMRQADPGRRLWVLRGDKLLYAVRSDPHAGYQEWAASEADVLKVLEDYDPEFVVVEHPPAKFDLPAARLLRRVLATRPEIFERVREFPLSHHNMEAFGQTRLVVYRKTTRNPHPRRQVEMNMLMQGSSVKAGLPTEK